MRAECQQGAVQQGLVPKREPVFARKGQLCLPSTMWGATSFPLWLQQPLKRSACTLLGEWKL